MKIYITAKPRSKKEYIKKLDSVHYLVAVTESPVYGKANQAIIQSLADYFNKPKSQITIISGEKSRQKVIDIPDTLEELNNT